MLDVREQIMAQLWTAFGQGAGSLRVSRDAATALHDRYYPLITPERIAAWDREGVQVLERMRAIGRLAAAKATARGASVISRDDVTSAAIAVEEEHEPIHACPRI